MKIASIRTNTIQPLREVSVAKKASSKAYSQPLRKTGLKLNLLA